MTNEYLESFSVIGIAVRTNNMTGAAAKNISALWQAFFEKQISNSIPNKIDDTLYCIYTDYEGDYTQDYTTVLGCKVSKVEAVPEGMVAVKIASGNYIKFEAQGKMSEGFVFKQWQTIWQSNIKRAYSTDFEVYDQRTQNPDDAVVAIFIASIS